MIDRSNFLPDDSSAAASCLADELPETGVEGSGGEKRNRKTGGCMQGGFGAGEVDASRSGDAMESFIPPLVTGQTQTGNTGCGIHKLCDFLIKRQPGYQIFHSHIIRKVSITESKRSQSRIPPKITCKLRYFLLVLLINCCSKKKTC